MKPEHLKLADVGGASRRKQTVKLAESESLKSSCHDTIPTVLLQKRVEGVWLQLEEDGGGRRRSEVKGAVRRLQTPQTVGNSRLAPFWDLNDADPQQSGLSGGSWWIF